MSYSTPTELSKSGSRASWPQLRPGHQPHLESDLCLHVSYVTSHFERISLRFFENLQPNRLLVNIKDNSPYDYSGRLYLCVMSTERALLSYLPNMATAPQVVLMSHKNYIDSVVVPVLLNGHTLNFVHAAVWILSIGSDVPE
jgi:hypothetical protein